MELENRSIKLYKLINKRKKPEWGTVNRAKQPRAEGKYQMLYMESRKEQRKRIRDREIFKEIMAKSFIKVVPYVTPQIQEAPNTP